MHEPGEDEGIRARKSSRSVARDIVICDSFDSKVYLRLGCGHLSFLIAAVTVQY